VATAKRFERVFKTLEKEAGGVIVRVSADFARRRIRESVEFGRSKGCLPPKEFSEMKAMLGPDPDLSTPHPLLALLDAEAVRAKGGLVFEGPKLLQQKVFASWFFDESSIKQCGLRLEEAEVSPLLMPERQKSERLERIIAETSREAVATSGREAWKQRLIENGYILYLLGEREPAEISLATALALDDLQSLPPFFPAMMRRTFRSEKDAPPEPKPPDGHLILP